MKNLNLKLIAALFVSISAITACKKSSNPPAFTGNYVIESAVLSEAMTVPTNEMGDVPIPAGTNITQLIQTALLSAVTCSSAANSYVELRADYSLYLSCQGANPLNAGTWEEVSATSLKLNLNSQAIPSSPTGFVLTVTDIVSDQSTLSGNTSVPLPKDLIEAMISSLNLTLTSDAPAIFTATFSVVFTRK
ncbi:MAG: hypothetical protein WCE64_12745 [Bacteroidales bacterium]